MRAYVGDNKPKYKKSVFGEKIDSNIYFFC